MMEGEEEGFREGGERKKKGRSSCVSALKLMFLLKSNQSDAWMDERRGE